MYPGMGLDHKGNRVNSGELHLNEIPTSLTAFFCALNHGYLFDHVHGDDMVFLLGWGQKELVVQSLGFCKHSPRREPPFFLLEKVNF